MMSVSANWLLSEKKVPDGPQTRYAPPVRIVKIPPLTPKNPIDTAMAQTMALIR